VIAEISPATARQGLYMQVPAEAAAQNPMIAPFLQATIGGKLTGQTDIPTSAYCTPVCRPSSDCWLQEEAEVIAKLLPPPEARSYQSTILNA
jgi:hypothetical protein